MYKCGRAILTVFGQETNLRDLGVADYNSCHAADVADDSEKPVSSVYATNENECADHNLLSAKKSQEG